MTGSGLLASAADFRHGIVLSPQRVGWTPADPPDVHSVAVPAPIPGLTRSVGGGAARDVADAEAAAVAEALERYAAYAARLPLRAANELRATTVLDLDEFGLFADDQLADPAFPHGRTFSGERAYTNVFSLTDNEQAWVRVELVQLRSEETGVSTSTGLAAAASPVVAMLRALQEVIERDALAVAWLHGVAPPRRPLAEPDATVVASLGGEATAVDATPAYSPHRVAFVAGWLPLRGRRRFGLGAACRATWREAVEKAYLEWVQAVLFAGFFRGATARGAVDVRTFDDHALYYTHNPDEWPCIPLLDGARSVDVDDGEEARPPEAQLERLAAVLHHQGIRVYYRELTPPDVRAVGLRVVRVLSPDLAPLACDERWRFLGRAVRDVAARYPWFPKEGTCFPNPLPHPLG